MKETNTKDIIIMIVLFPVIVLFLLVVLIYTPFDYLKYKRSRYYKDTKEKYSWFCASSAYIKFYDLIKNENLPIEFYRCDDASFTSMAFLSTRIFCF